MSKARLVLNWIVVVGMLSVMLAGCAQTTTAPATEAAATEALTSENTTAAVPESTTPTIDNTTATLTIWTGFPELEPFYRDVAAQFQKTHPNVKFEFLSTTLREFEAKLQTALPAGSGPDIFDAGSNIAPILVAGQLIDPNPTAVDAQLKSGSYSDYVVNYFTYDGKTYGIPMLDGSLASLYYNKDLFTKAGLDPNTPPTTFDELMTDAKKLTEYDANGNITVSGLSLRLSGQGSGIDEKFWFFLHNMGGDIIASSDSGKTWHNDYNNEAGQKALKFYIDAVYKEHVTDQQVPSDSTAFEAGQAAMLLRESWVIGDIAKNSPNLNYGVAPMPRDVRWDTLTQPNGVYVSKSSKNASLAWDYVQLLTSKENTVTQVKETGWVSPRQDADMSAITSTTPQYGVFVNPPSDLGYYAYPTLTCYDEIMTKMADKLTAAYLDKTLLDNPDGIAKAMKAMADETDSILKENGIYGQ